MQIPKALKIAAIVFFAVIVMFALYNVFTRVRAQMPTKQESFVEKKGSAVESVASGDQGLKIILVFATWCGHCEKYIQSGVFTSISNDLKKNAKYADKVAFEQLDYDKNKAVATQYDVSSFPSIIAVKDGKVVGRFNGDRYSKAELIEFVDAHL